MSAEAGKASVGYGMAFDIAGHGLAHAESMAEAITVAAALVSENGLP